MAWEMVRSVVRGREGAFLLVGRGVRAAFVNLKVSGDSNVVRSEVNVRVRLKMTVWQCEEQSLQAG